MTQPELFPNGGSAAEKSAAPVPTPPAVEPAARRAFKGIWIPAPIWEHPELSVAEKVLAAEIDSLDGGEGCFASIGYLAEFLGVDERQVQRYLSTLRAFGLVEEIPADPAKGRTYRRLRLTTQALRAGGDKNVTPPVTEMSPPGRQKCHPYNKEDNKEEKRARGARGDDSVPEFPKQLNTPEVRAAWDRFVQMRREQRFPKLKGGALTAAMNRLRDLTPAEAVETIELSIASTWRGLFPAKINRGGYRRTASKGDASNVDKWD